MMGRTRTLAKMTVLLLVLICISSTAMATPIIPSTFSGTVLINDADAPIDTVIEAYVVHDGDMIQYGSAILDSAGTYAITIGADPYPSLLEIDIGKELLFKVTNINATERTVVPNQGLDLVHNLTAYDTTAPVTTHDAPSGWQNSSFTINLTAIDSGSGVNSTFYKVNDGSWTSGTSVLIDVDGNNTVMYYSVDNVGNVESNNTVYAKLDTTAPVTTDDAPSGWQNNSFTITLTASDSSGSGVNSTFYKVNDGSWTSGNSVLIDTDGNNTVMYYTVDNVGNVESTNTVYAKLDTTTPVVYIDPVTTPTNVSSQIITGTIVETSLASVTVNGESALLDGNNYSATIDLTEGDNTVTVVAFDYAGNTDDNSTSIVLDSTNPVVFIDPVTTPTNVSSQIITGTIVETSLDSVTVNGIAALLDGNNYSATIDLTEGDNTVTVVAFDSAGNTGSNSTSIVLDITNPVVYIDPVDAYTNVSSQTITGTVEETNLVSVTVNGESASLDGNNYSATIDLTEGDNTVTVVALDYAGNTDDNSTSIVLNLGLDPVPPVLSDLTIVPGKILNMTTDWAIVTVNVTDEISGLNNVTIDLSEINESITEMTYLGNDIYSYSISTQMVGNFSFNITAVDNADNDVTSSQFYLNVTTSDEVIGSYSGGDSLSSNEVEQAIADNEAGLVSDKIVLALIEDYFSEVRVG